jgi:tetratricopeptide (TPR) repeat protein
VAAGIEVTRPVDVMLVASSNGPLGVWLDGTSLIEWDGERPLSDWQHTVAVRLDPGRHLLMARVGHRTARPALFLRVVDKHGLLPKGVTLLPPTVVEGTPPASSTFATSRRLPAALGDLAGVKGQPSLKGRLGLMVIRETTGRRKAADDLLAAIAERPNDPELYYLLGRAERDDINRQMAAWKRAVALSTAKGGPAGAHAEALAALLQLHRSEKLGPLADETAQQLRRADPHHPAFLAHDVFRIAQYAGAGAALVRLTDEPRRHSSAQLAILYGSLLDQAGRLVDAAAVYAEAAILAAGATDAVRPAVLTARRADRSQQAVDWTSDALTRRPYSIDLHLLRARALIDAPDGGPAAALVALDRATTLHPNSPELHEAAGRFHLLDGELGKAIAAFDIALELQPQNRALADYRRLKLSQRSLADRHAVPLETVLASAIAPNASAPARYLLAKHAIEVFPSGLSSEFRQMVIRIDDERATERFEQMVFPYTPGEDRVDIIEAEVIRKDGSRLRPQQIGDSRPGGKSGGVYTLRVLKVVRFGDLQAGDVVHVQIRKDEVGRRNLFGDFFGTVVPISSDLPKDRVEVVVDAPADRPLFTDGVGIGQPKRTLTNSKDGDRAEDRGKRQRLSWTLTNVAPILFEPSMPGYGDIGAYLSVSTFESWEQLATWYRDLIKPQLAVSEELTATARALVANATTVREKVAAIQAWVVRHTRYVGIEFGIHGFKPYRVTEVVSRGYGDCKDKASLLVAMLDVVGVRGEFVLVRTRNLGALEKTPATLWAFNHAIAYVPALDTYIDGTSEFAGLDELPELDQGAMVLRIDVLDVTKPPVLTQIPQSTPANNLIRSTNQVTLLANGDAEVRLEDVVAGTAAPSLRYRLQDKSARDKALAQIISSQHPGAELVGTRFEHLDSLGIPVVLSVDAKLPRLATKGPGTLELSASMDTGQLLERYGTLPTRTQPLVLDHTQREVEETTVTIPSGMEIARLPKPVSVETRFGSYSLDAEPVAAGYRVRSVLEIAMARIEPADYPAFRAFLEAVTAARGARVQLTTK